MEEFRVQNPVFNVSGLRAQGFKFRVQLSRNWGCKIVHGPGYARLPCVLSSMYEPMEDFVHQAYQRADVQQGVMLGISD